MGHISKVFTRPDQFVAGEQVCWIHPSWGWMGAKVVRVNKGSVTIKGDDGITRNVRKMANLGKPGATID